MDWINEEGGFNMEATDMPEPVKELVSKKGYSGVVDLAEAYRNAEKKFGVDPNRLLTLPDKPDDQEGWGNLYSKLGRPETPDQYKPEITPYEGQEVSPDLTKKFGEFAHSIGLNNTQLSKIMQWQLDLTNEYTTAQAAEAQKAQEIAEADKVNAQAKAWEALKVKNSVKTDDDLKTLTDGAKQAAEKIGLYEILEKKGLGDDVEVIAALIETNRKLSDSFTTKETGELTEESRDAQLQEIMNDPAFGNNMDPRHEKLQKRFLALHGLSV